ncbi:MAG: LolA-like outer membrane lipoprotein chaperone [Sulfurimonas sp.]|nr:LolA-like outer membrane lipoprotein chaperone [Sulfurimonas sp.]
MKYILFTMILITQVFASLVNINSFEADFVQSITDDKKNVLTYTGHIIASKPQNARWNYIKPVQKEVYINRFEVTIIEPVIEQVIIKRVELEFDFFNMISKAKKIKKDTYLAKYNNSEFTIILYEKLIKSIIYIDEFENNVEIVFKNQKQNNNIDLKKFTPVFPLYYDIIKD